MADITFTVTAALGGEIADAFGYEAQVPNPNGDGTTVNNPETKVQFVKRITMEWWKGQVMNTRHQKAREAASAGVDGSVPIT